MDNVSWSFGRTQQFLTDDHHDAYLSFIQEKVIHEHISKSI